MNSITFVILLFPLFVQNEYVLENCFLYSRNHKLTLDFSGNLENEDWVTQDGMEFLKNATYYFSLCPENQSKCPNKGFFCVKLNNDTVLDLGSDYIGTVEEDNGDDVLFNMTIKGMYGSGLVHIRCDGSTADPIIIELNRNLIDGRPYYNYIIQWSSRTNCPMKQFITQNSCMLYTSSRSYDLRALQSSISVEGPASRRFIINFCEIANRVKCPTYVCEVVNGDIKSVSDSFEMRYLENKGLSFIFRIFYSGEKLIINLNCGSQSQELNYVSRRGNSLVFNMNTSFICESPTMECLLHPKVNAAYDISPLQKNIGNYELRLNNGKRMILNFCRPLNFIHHIACADGHRNFGCLVEKDNTIEAIATKVNVTIVQPGKISVIYHGSGNNGLFLNITLKCSNHITAYPYPTNIYEINAYSYNIIWNTYTACPLKYSIGKNCEVNNLYYDIKMNFMPLFKKGSDHYILNGKESFRINVCGKLNLRCAKNPEAAVCYKNSEGKEMAIGETGSLEPTFVDGQFIFHLKGEPCHKNATMSKIKIIIACQFSNESLSNDGPELFHSSGSKDDCLFYFYWKTPLACGPSISSKCMYSDNNVKYDLSSLINFRENYVITYNDSQIELNVCHSLVSGYRTQCHEFSGACLKNNSVESILAAAHQNHENTENLGMVSEQDEFKVIGNKIRLHYGAGGICMTGKEHSVYSTTIDFICDKTLSHSEPKLIGINDCNYYFTWKTSAACPYYKKKTLCTTIDRESKKKFDLTSLMGKDVLVEGSKIVLGICHPVGLKGCPENSGACIMRNNSYENIGNYSSQLQYTNKSLFLDYESSNCKFTRIEFQCSDTSDSKPVFIKETNCTTYISWPTSRACLNDNGKLNCCQGIEDLCEKLIETYEVGINETEKIFISICKPLLPKTGLLCPLGSLVCRAKNLSQYAYVLEKSLGSVILPPEKLNDSSVILKYINGSVCHEGSDSTYSTSITFVCDKNVTNGHPELINITNDCRYEFKWVTSLICSEKCSLLNENKNMNFLRQFLDYDNRIVLKNEHRNPSPYVLNLCKVSKKCGSHICKLGNNRWQGFGIMNSSHIAKIADTKTEIFYNYQINTTKKDTCGAKVDLICDINDSPSGRPYLEEERNCFIYVIWKTKFACPTEKPSVSSSNIGVWILVTIVILALVGIVIAFSRLNNRLNLRSFLNNILGHRMASHVTELAELASEAGVDEEEMYLIKNR